MGKIIYIKEGKNLSIQIKDILTGRVIKGPLSAALVYLEDATGVKHLVDTTNGSGYFSADLSAFASSANVVKVTAVSTISSVDIATGAIASGLVLSAPAQSSVVTPLTSIITESDLSQAELKVLLGLSESINLLTFDPYEAADNDVATLYESKSLQVYNIISSLKSAIQSSSVSSNKAFNIAINGLVNHTKSLATGAVINLSDLDTIDSIAKAAKDALVEADIAGVDTDVFDNTIAKVRVAIKDTNKSIEDAASTEGATVEDLEASSTQSNNLVNQVANQADAEKEAIDSGTEAPNYVAVNRTALTNENIGTIVNKWIADPTDDVFTNDENEEYYGDIKTWDVSKVTDMSGLFKHKHSFNDDISKWDVSNVTDMNAMFCNALKFNQDISGWNVTRVTDMSYMFSNAKEFNQDISGWNVSSVTDMSAMFLEATKFNKSLSAWGDKVSKVLDMTYMFLNSGFTATQSVTGWEFNAGVDKDSMFCLCDKYEKDLSGNDLSACDLSGIDLSGVDLSGCDLSGTDLSGVDCSHFTWW